MSKTNEKRSWRGAAIRIGGSILILALLLWWLPRDKLWAAIRGVPPSVFALVVLSFLATHLVGIIKWRVMVNIAGAGLNYGQAAQCYFAGLFGNVFLPSVVGGDLIRAGLALKMGRNRAGTLFGSLLDRMLDVAALGAVAGIGALLLPGALDPQNRRVFWALAAVFAAGGMGAALAAAFFPVRRLPFKVRRKLAKLRHAIRSMAAQPHRVALAFVLAMIMQSNFVLMNVELAEACGLNLPVHIWFFAWPIAKLSALLPVSQGGIGVRETVLVVLLRPFGAPGEKTVAAGFTWQFVIIVSGLISGLLSLLLARVTGTRRTAAASSVPSET